VIYYLSELRHLDDQVARQLGPSAQHTDVIATLFGGACLARLERVARRFDRCCSARWVGVEVVVAGAGVRFAGPGDARGCSSFGAQSLPSSRRTFGTVRIDALV
jgi:hypothetical protein